ncbi:alpha-hydroxy-acid oxidizing protein [Pseudomonadota bacterium]
MPAFGQPGVEKVLEILRAELVMVMGQMGAPALEKIGSEHPGRS